MFCFVVVVIQGGLLIFMFGILLSFLVSRSLIIDLVNLYVVFNCTDNLFAIAFPQRLYTICF